MLWKNHPRAVMACLLTLHVLAHIDRNMLLGFSPQITRDLALSNARYGLLAGAVWVLSYGVMAVITGSFADRYSRTRVMAAGILIWSVCTAASGAARSFEAMVAARFLVASGEAALVPASVSLIAELFSERRRGSAMGVFFTGIPLGIGFSFVLAGTVGATHGWRDTFYSLGVVGAVVALLVSLLKDERGGLMKLRRK
ncbi:MFS transporter [Cupriavidus basilensis]